MKTSDEHPQVYNPPPEEIEQAVQQIQAKWDDDERHYRHWTGRPEPYEVREYRIGE